MTTVAAEIRQASDQGLADLWRAGDLDLAPEPEPTPRMPPVPDYRPRRPVPVPDYRPRPAPGSLVRFGARMTELADRTERAADRIIAARERLEGHPKASTAASGQPNRDSARQGG